MSNSLESSVLAKQHWSYDETGPNYWSEEYSACGGKAQSPINIQTYKVTKVLVSYSVKSLNLEVTPSATQFCRQSYKISHPLRLKVSWDALPSFASLASHVFGRKNFDY